MTPLKVGDRVRKKKITYKEMEDAVITRDLVKALAGECIKAIGKKLPKDIPPKERWLIESRVMNILWIRHHSFAYNPTVNEAINSGDIP